MLAPVQKNRARLRHPLPFLDRRGVVQRFPAQHHARFKPPNNYGRFLQSTALKHDQMIAFKLHQLLRHKGYSTLRRCLRVLQNPPACAALRRAISFPCHCKTVVGFGSPYSKLQPHPVALIAASFRLYIMVSMRGAHS